jgi:hypothetical protein
MGAKTSFDYSARLRGFYMRKLFLATAASAAALVAVAAPASAQTVITLVPGPGGSLTGGFESEVVGGTVATPAGFSQTFTFALPAIGTTSSSITSISTMMSNDIDFTSVLLNGTALQLGSSGPTEFRFINNLATVAGIQTLVVNGISRGSGSFGGSVSFSPTAAVPEPTTWALLLLGFAAIGFSMRRSKASVRETRVRYNFA